MDMFFNAARIYSVSFHNKFSLYISSHTLLGMKRLCARESCSKIVNGPEDDAFYCDCGCRMAMWFLCKFCGEAFQPLRSIRLHEDICYVCPFCGNNLEGCIEFVHHLLPHLFVDRPLRNMGCPLIFGLEPL